MVSFFNNGGHSSITRGGVVRQRGQKRNRQSRNRQKELSKESGGVASYGNEDINFIIKHLKEKCSLNKLDGSDKENRRFAYLAIKKFGSKERVAEIIDIAAGDKFWSGQVSSIKHIYYNGVKIALSLKNKLKNYVEYERIEQK